MTAPMEVQAPSPSQHEDAFMQLNAAHQDISVKSLMDLRGILEASSVAQSISMAAIALVAGLDNTVEVGQDGLPPRTLEAILGALSKPGHLINALRRFPYAVDSGKVPDANIIEARQNLEEVTEAAVQSEHLVQYLFRWVYSALVYFEAVRGPSVAELASKVQDSVGPAMQLDQQPASAFPSAGIPGQDATPERPSIQPAAPSLPMPGTSGADQQSPERAVRSSMGSKASPGTVSLSTDSSFLQNTPGKSPTSTTAAKASQDHSVSMQRSQDRLSQASAPNQGRSPNKAAPRSGISTTPMSSPASPFLQGNQARRTSTASRMSGYSQAHGPRLGVQDWKDKLDRIKKETRLMKAQEKSMKFQMKKEEDELKKNEKKGDQQDIVAWRQQQSKLALEYAAETKRAAKKEQLTESKEFQEHKRVLKHMDKEHEMKIVKEDYLETKEHSEHAVELKKSLPPQLRKQIVDEHLEQYHFIASYNMEEAKKDRLERMEAQLEVEQREMAHRMMLAEKEHEAALASLEHLKTQKPRDVPENKHLAAYPK